jgi:hypothetical protein
MLMLGVSLANAKPVTPASAKTVAENFYKQNSGIAVNSVSLAYTEVSADGLPVFYVFNINDKDGFVIVTAEDAVKPILGYSTKNSYVLPTAHTAVGGWLTSRASEITEARKQNQVADAKATNEWARYSNNNASTLKLNNNATVLTATVAPLVQTTWNQEPYYNDSCPILPGVTRAVTGCVATTMAQIMRYWNYPAHGTGTSSYSETTAKGDYETYGTLSANYAATTYNWANMPLALGTHNSDVAKLMNQCGVSVNMDYGPSESGAFVLTSDNAISAQRAYVKYFSYDPNIIAGYYRSSYTDASWIALIESDLLIGRPVQYAGQDPKQGGHTWVCDGFDVNNNLHMNWGWGGDDDGFFSINNLLTTNGSPAFNPSTDHEILMGIVPMATGALDIGIPAITAPVGSFCSNANNTFTPVIKLQNYGSSMLTTCNINYVVDNNGAVQIQTWNGSLVTGQNTMVSLQSFNVSAGTHTLTCYSSSPNDSTDLNATNDQSVIIFNVSPNGGILPIVEGFETANALPSSDWSVSHTASTGVDWAVTTNGAATGLKSCMIDNMNNTAGNNSIIQTFSTYDLSTLTSPALSFKVAYQQKATTNNDKLQVYSSVDCGATWVSRLARSGSALSTVSGTLGTTFMPVPANFVTYTVNINAVATSKSVQFRWEFYADPNGPGNNLYIDDINLFDASATGIQTIEAAVNLNLYPNPSANQVNIGFNLSEKHSIAVTVTDMLGRSVETIDAKSYQAGESTLTIGAKTAYQAGIYLVNIDIDGQHIAKKIIIQ